MHYLYSLVRLGKFQRIQHIFPIWWHSFLPCDRDFTKTESKKKKADCVYTPEEWMEVIKWARKLKPFTVVPLSQDMVFDFNSHLSTFFKKTVSCDGERLKIREVRLFEYSREHSFEVWAKYSLCQGDQWCKATIEKRKIPAISFPTSPLYSGTLSINPNKVEDLHI